MRANRPAVKAGLALQSCVPNVFFWQSSPRDETIGTEWTRTEFVFRVPGPGEPAHREELSQAVIRIHVFGADSGVLVDDVLLEEIEMLDAWQPVDEVVFPVRDYLIVTRRRVGIDAAHI
jgi:hypothetical protein